MLRSGPPRHVVGTRHTASVPGGQERRTRWQSRSPVTRHCMSAPAPLRRSGHCEPARTMAWLRSSVPNAVAVKSSPPARQISRSSWPPWRHVSRHTCVDVLPPSKRCMAGWRGSPLRDAARPRGRTPPVEHRFRTSAGSALFLISTTSRNTPSATIVGHPRMLQDSRRAADQLTKQFARRPRRGLVSLGRLGFRGSHGAIRSRQACRPESLRRRGGRDRGVCRGNRRSDGRQRQTLWRCDRRAVGYDGLLGCNPRASGRDGSAHGGRGPHARTGRASRSSDASRRPPERRSDDLLGDPATGVASWRCRVPLRGTAGTRRPAT